MEDKETGLYLTIITLYGQQKYMYDNKVHSVEHRIVSISQSWIRPVVRWKVKASVGFGAKFDLSLDSEGYGRIEKISFEAYNGSTCLIEAAERNAIFNYDYKWREYHREGNRYYAGWENGSTLWCMQGVNGAAHAENLSGY